MDVYGWAARRCRTSGLRIKSAMTWRVVLFHPLLSVLGAVTGLSLEAVRYKNDGRGEIIPTNV